MQKKVLIISYFFPPCSLTAAQRAQGWANYLSDHGYYPTIVTRRWDQDIRNPEDALLSSETEVIHEKNDRFEVYYLPYKASMRDRLYTRFSGSKLQKLSRLFTFFSLIAENFTLRAIPYRNIHTFSKKWLDENSDTSCAIITGLPFNQFFFGYKLHQKTGLKWIADYRDDWNTSDFVGTSGTGFLMRMVKKLNIRSEQKWVGTAACITSISPFYAEKISNFVKRPGFVILNGFEVEVPPSKLDPTNFVLTYNGSLYATQPVEDLLAVAQRLIIEDKLPLYLKFPGAAFDPIQKKRIENAGTKILDRIEITERIPRADVLQLQADSDALLMLSHTDMKGIPSSKLYEYFPFKKPIVHYPNDFDIVESTLRETGLGFSTSSQEELYETIKLLIQQKLEHQATLIHPNLEKIESYSRKMQTKALSELFDKIEKNG